MPRRHPICKRAGQLFVRPCLTLACCAGAAITHAAPPTLQFIPPPAGYADSFGEGLSADGSTALIITGTLNTYNIDLTATGLWTVDSGLTMLPNPGNATMWLGRGIGAAGDSVLASVIDANDVETYWSWSASRGWSQVDALTGDFTYIGSSSSGAAAITLGFNGLALWTPASGLTKLVTPGESADAVGTNADGSVVVGWHNQSPARWMPATGWQPLVTAGFNGHALALACSDSGDTIVGRGRATSDEWNNRIWWWDASRARLEWITPPQFEQPDIQAMSASGRVAVGNLARSASVITRENGLTDLNALLAAQGVDTQGSWLLSASAVSADGRTIVGTAGRGNAPDPTHTEAFILTLELCSGDVGRAGGLHGADGLLDNNDFIAFIDCFFSRLAVGDRAGAGAAPQPDGLFDSNDFVVFIDQFFAGC